MRGPRCSAAWCTPRCDGPRIPRPRPPHADRDAFHDYRAFRDDRPFRLPEPTGFELLLEEGINAALDPHPYLGRHRLHAPDHGPALARAA